MIWFGVNGFSRVETGSPSTSNRTTGGCCWAWALIGSSYLRFDLGARCERALAAAVFDFLPVLLLRSTADAVLATLADVLRLRAMGHLRRLLQVSNTVRGYPQRSVCQTSVLESNTH